jgi:hypothetical protein
MISLWPLNGIWGFNMFASLLPSHLVHMEHLRCREPTIVSVMYGIGVQLLGSDLNGTEANALVAVRRAFRVGARNNLAVNILI